jgi:hypothetical protein
MLDMVGEATRREALKYDAEVEASAAAAAAPPKADAAAQALVGGGRRRLGQATTAPAAPPPRPTPLPPLLTSAELATRVAASVSLVLNKVSSGAPYRCLFLSPLVSSQPCHFHFSWTGHTFHFSFFFFFF